MGAERMVDGTLPILLVDDDEVDRLDICELLGKLYEFVEAESEAQAEEYLEKETPLCILLDYRIPGCDTLKFLNHLSNERRLPVVMLTGEGNEGIAVEAMKQGAKDYLVKGDLSSEKLHRAITNAIEKAQYEKELENKHQELEDFAFVASHDLNAPLYNIRQASELLAEECEKSPSSRSQLLLGVISRGCIQMTTLISDLLEYSRTGRTNAQFESIDLNEVAEQAVSNLDARILEADAAVELGPLPKIFGDATSFLQLFQNLISNGIKFRGDQSPKVHVSCSSVNKEWHVTVQDNGIGIKPEDQETVFKAFERLHSQSDYQGSGIGLATCKKVIDQHGGKIWIESQLGKGTRIHFTIPKVPAENHGASA
ncbi:ATP-binding protein [Oligoflexia bacterium]|nr:ATP-binding protein [Oligoflexia bacterium]